MKENYVTDLYKGRMGSSYFELVTSTDSEYEWLSHPMAQVITSRIPNGRFEVDLGENGFSLMFVGNALEIAHAERFIYEFSNNEDDIAFFEQEDEDKINLDPITKYVTEKMRISDHDLHIIEVDSLEDEYAKNFRKPWAVQYYDGKTIEFDTEAEACAVQRMHRKAHRM